MRRILLLLVSFVMAAALRAQAPAGFYTSTDEDAGFSFHCPNLYQPLPVPPGDPVLVARYLKKGSPAAELLLLRITKPRVVTPSPGDVRREVEESDEERKPRTHEEALQERLRVDSLEEFLEKRLSKAKVQSREEVKGRKFQYSQVLFSLKGRKGIAFSYDCSSYWGVLLATVGEDEFDGEVRQLTKSGQSIEWTERSDDSAEWERFYRLRPQYLNPEFRLERRRGLVRGWKGIDTTNYLILHNSKDTALLAAIENDIEAIRSLYEELFPAVRPVEAVSVVRLCKDREEYLSYGGAKQSAGYWNSVRQELVMYDNVGGQQGSRLGNRDSLIVLYHEAFHQYIHYAVGELPPHSWFNEGFGDYFSGAVIYKNSQRVKKIGSNPWRLGTIQKAIADAKQVPLVDLIQAEQSEYYQPDKARLYYAEGWSLIYFLNNAPVVRKNEAWQQILPVYFETLKAVYQLNRSELPEGASLEAKEEAGKQAREVAVKEAFRGIDLAELEAEWKAYTTRVR